MPVTGGVQVDLYKKTVLDCQGINAGLLGWIFRTPVVISDAFDLSGNEVNNLGQQVQCMYLRNDGICEKNNAEELCFLLRKPLRA